MAPNAAMNCLPHSSSLPAAGWHGTTPSLFAARAAMRSAASMYFAPPATAPSETPRCCGSRATPLPVATPWSPRRCPRSRRRHPRTDRSGCSCTRRCSGVAGAPRRGSAWRRSRDRRCPDPRRFRGRYPFPGPGPCRDPAWFQALRGILGRRNAFRIDRALTTERGDEQPERGPAPACAVEAVRSKHGSCFWGFGACSLARQS